jgi:hypothetical protein
VTDLTGPDGPVPDPRAGRFQPLVTGARMAVGMAFALAVGGMLLPDPVATWCAVAAIAVVMTAPIVRVIWLAARWFRRGDRRFGWVAVGVLGVVSIAVVLAAL